MKKTYFLLLLFWVPLLANAQDKDIFDPAFITELKMTFQDANWSHILDSLKQKGNEKRLLADVEYNGKLYKGVGVRYKGNSSYFNVSKSGDIKLPFNLDFNHTIKDQKLPGGYDKLKLSNIFRDPSFLREVLSYEIAGRYMPAPKANFIKVYANGVYLGLYNNTESIDEDFLEKHFQEEKGILIKCDPIWSYEESPNCPKGDKSSLQYLGPDSACYRGLYEVKGENGWLELIQLTKTLESQPEKLDSVFDVDKALWMMAFNIVLVNLDSYTGQFCHNYYLYQDSHGVFHPLVWDMNLSFGGFRYDGLGAALTNTAMQELSPFVHYKQNNEKRPLITNLLGNSLYRKIYIAHIKTILNDYFLNDAYLKRAEELQTLIDPYVKEDQNKLYSYEAFQQNLDISTKAGNVSIIGIKELMEPRRKYLASHPLIAKAQPLIASTQSLDLGTEVVFEAKIEGTSKAWLFFRELGGGAFKKVEMFDDGGHNDQSANDNIWAATVPKGEKNMHYFYVAEGEANASLSPERAAHEFYEFIVEKAK